MADLIFPEHALERMRQRGITSDQVHETVEDADTIIGREDGPAEYFRFLDDGRELVVVIEDDGVTVVSVIARKQRRPRRRWN